MSFSCKISNLGIKSFAQAINACCKLGEDIYLDATPAKLTIKVLNEPYKSAFMFISFDSDFFESYEVEGRLSFNDDMSMVGDSQSNGNRSVNSRDAKVSCKLKTRSCLLAFKKEKTLVKNLDYCEIKIKSSSDKAQFKFTYNSKCVKTMGLPLGGDGLDVTDDIFQRGKHKVTCKARILSDILTYFAKEDEYITMKANPQSIDFETHFVDRDKSGKLTKTNIDIDEFDAYNVSEDVFLTFSLRLIRPFLSFCSSRIPEVDIFMDGSNQPICFSAESPPHIKIALAIATLDVNRPNVTRNSSRSSVMYQTNRSSQVDGITENATRRSRFSSQNSQSNTQNSRNSFSSWNQDDQDILDARVISNEEQHTSVTSARERHSRLQDHISSTPSGTEDIDMLENEDDDIMLADLELPNQSNHDVNSRTNSQINRDFEDVPASLETNSQNSLSVSQSLHFSRNGSQPTSTPLPSVPIFVNTPLQVSAVREAQEAPEVPERDDDYWMSLPVNEQREDSEDELLVPPTDDEDESEIDSDTF